MKVASYVFRLLIVMTGLSCLVGCATENNIPMSEQFWQTKHNKVAIAKQADIRPELYKAGQQGLLDYAINSAVTHAIDTKIAQSDEGWYDKLPNQFADKLKQRNVAVAEISTPLNTDKIPARTLAASVGADKLLVLNLEQFGAIRNYYAFIPTSAPKAYCVLTGKLIDTRTNQVLWRHRTYTMEDIQGPWDQPPHYPNVMRAIKVASRDAREELLDSFFSGH